MENWMIILNEVIKWGSIIACIVWPVYIIKKGCITYVIEKRISATESKKNEILWTCLLYTSDAADDSLV